MIARKIKLNTNPILIHGQRCNMFTARLARCCFLLNLFIALVRRIIVFFYVSSSNQNMLDENNRKNQRCRIFLTAPNVQCFCYKIIYSNINDRSFNRENNKFNKTKMLIIRYICPPPGHSQNTVIGTRTFRTVIGNVLSEKQKKNCGLSSHLVVAINIKSDGSFRGQKQRYSQKRFKSIL